MEPKEKREHPFVVCSGPMRRYMEQIFAYGEYRDVVQLAQLELKDNPYNLDMILYQALGVLELQVRDMIPFSTSLVDRALSQLRLLQSAANIVGVSIDAGLEYYQALGSLLLGDLAQADRLMEYYRRHEAEYGEILEEYEAFRSLWSARTKAVSGRRHGQNTYVS